MASSTGATKREEDDTPSVESIKDGFKIFLKLDLEIKKNEATWFDRFGDKYLVDHLHRKWVSSNRCAILFYNRLDGKNRWEMIKNDTTFKIAEAVSVTSLGITSYMNYYLGVKFDQDKDLEVQPSGVTAKNRNYDYANSKFVGSLD